MEKNKLKFEYTSGCTAFSTNVNGKELVDMTREEILGYIDILLKKEEDTAVLQDIFESLMESLGEYEDLGHCECCGDWVSSYKLEI